MAVRLNKDLEHMVDPAIFVEKKTFKPKIYQPTYEPVRNQISNSHSLKSLKLNSNSI